MKGFTSSLLALGMAAALASPVVLAKEPAAGNSTRADTSPSKAIAGPDSSKDSKAATHASMRDEAKAPPGKGNWWADADVDADGKISLAEAAANAGLNAKFATIDSDTDGFVTMDEYRAYYTATASQGDGNQ